MKGESQDKKVKNMNELKLSDLTAIISIPIHLEERNGKTYIYGSD